MKQFGYKFKIVSLALVLLANNDVQAYFGESLWNKIATVATQKLSTNQTVGIEAAVVTLGIAAACYYRRLANAQAVESTKKAELKHESSSVAKPSIGASQTTNMVHIPLGDGYLIGDWSNVACELEYNGDFIFTNPNKEISCDLYIQKQRNVTCLYQLTNEIFRSSKPIFLDVPNLNTFQSIPVAGPNHKEKDRSLQVRSKVSLLLSADLIRVFYIRNQTIVLCADRNKTLNKMIVFVKNENNDYKKVHENILTTTVDINAIDYLYLDTQNCLKFIFLSQFVSRDLD